ncbi:family S53 protease-like protein [Mycena olivaceomarginata]|nr:family S53 protease-like protein [Mycena olivaceomarginata]
MIPLRAFLAVLSFIAASAGRTVVHESRAAAPNGFISQGAAPADEALTLRFALAANNLAGLEAKLTSLSTPGSPEFRQWLSKDEVKAFVQPSAETVAAFDAFASANGLKPTVISPNGDWVSLTLPVSQADKLFAAKFELFTHPDLAGPITADALGVPTVRAEFLPPTSPRLAPSSSFRPLTAQDAPAASCNTSLAEGTITPTCLQELYGIPSDPATQPNNTLLVTGYVGEWAQTADLSKFLTLLRPDISPNATFSLLTADGGTNPQGTNKAGIERQPRRIATGVPSQFLSVGATFLDGVDSPPTGRNYFVWDEHSVRAGISVVFASGDGACAETMTISPSALITSSIPVFPAACPFVTTVGSTIGFSPEVAVNFTGGGFSNFFPAPSYQASAISGFPRHHPLRVRRHLSTRAGGGTPTCRCRGGTSRSCSGARWASCRARSASAPTFAAIIALINDRLLAAGASTAFTDITSGHNSGSACPASSVAFDAAVGWDPLNLLAAALA